MLLRVFSLFWVFIGPTAAACNGYEELCSRQYSNVSQIGTHDSAFVGSFVTDNQGVSVTDQLNAGIRFLQAQTHSFLDDIYLCHTSCWEENSGLLVDYLQTVATWLAANPNEVLTFLVTNQDAIAVTSYATAMTTAGLANYAYTPPSQLAIGDWPTLQELIDADTRLVMFMDYHADVSEVSYILDEFTYFFETPYDVTTPTFPQCTLDRPPGSNGDGLMIIVNHFLDLDVLGIDVPDNSADTTTNAATGTGSIGAQADLCIAQWERTPKFILVDYFENGDVFTAQATLNGL